MIYFKIINDRQVFSDCRTIQLEFDHLPLVAGQYVSNPDEELILADGWQVYVPPVVPPRPELEPEYDDIVDAVKTMLQSSCEKLTDEEALEIAALYPTWYSMMGKEVSVGQRYWYNNKLYKVIQAHTVQEDWTPDVTASLYTEVSIEEWPEWRQPLGSEDAYHIGDKVSHNDKHWQSTVDGNVWEPSVYGWDEV